MHLMVVIPIDADVDEAKHLAPEHWEQGLQRSQSRAVGHFHLHTTMVMMIAITPSLNASSLLLPIAVMIQGPLMRLQLASHRPRQFVNNNFVCGELPRE